MHWCFGLLSNTLVTDYDLQNSSPRYSQQIVCPLLSHLEDESEIPRRGQNANWRLVGFDTEPPKVWIDHGGQLVLPYLGSSAQLDLNSTLTFFMNRLDSIPWGWATLFRQVLGKLLTSDDGGGSDDGDP